MITEEVLIAIVGVIGTIIVNLIITQSNRKKLLADIEVSRQARYTAQVEREQKLQKQIDDLRDENTELFGSIEKLREEKVAEQEKARAFEDRLQRLTEAHEALRKEHAAALEYNVMLNQTIREKTNEVAILTRANIELRTEKEGLINTILKFERTTQELQEKMKIVESSTTQLKKTTDRLTKQ